MWIFLNDAMLSIVKHRTKPAMLLVRARRKKDIKQVFPAARVKSTPKADYPFRAEVERTLVAAAIADRLQLIDYDNFKNAVRDNARHNVYLRVWRDVHGLEMPRPSPRPSPPTQQTLQSLYKTLGYDYAADWYDDNATSEK